MPSKGNFDKVTTPETSKENEDPKSQPSNIATASTTLQSEPTQDKPSQSAPIKPEHKDADNGIDAKLKQMKQSFEQAQSQLQQLAREGEVIKQQVAELEKANSDIKQIVTSYKKSSIKAEKDKQDLETFLSTKGRMVEAAAGPHKEQIKNLKTEREHRREELVRRRDAASQQYTEASVKFQAATKDLEEKKKVWESLKSFQQSLDIGFKQFAALKSQFEQEDDKNNAGAMYFLIQEMRDILAHIKIVSPDDLEKDLEKAWSEVMAASGSLREIEGMRKSAQASLETEESALKTFSDKWREDLLKDIKNLEANNRTQSTVKA